MDLLLTIQRLDDEIKETRQEIEKIPNKLATLEKEIKNANISLQEKNDRIKEIKKIYKIKEGDIAENENKINKLNSQTFSVKTNEEYRAILAEVEYLKKENKRIEDEMINLLEEEEKLKVTIGKFETETKIVIEKKMTEINNLQKLNEELIERKRQDEISFENNFNKLADDVKEAYQRIDNVRDKAVCVITDNTCTGCYANLTHQFMNELKKKNKLRVCGNCGRILIYVEK